MSLLVGGNGHAEHLRTWKLFPSIRAWTENRDPTVVISTVSLVADELFFLHPCRDVLAFGESFLLVPTAIFRRMGSFFIDDQWYLLLQARTTEATWGRSYEDEIFFLSDAQFISHVVKFCFGQQDPRESFLFSGWCNLR